MRRLEKRFNQRNIIADEFCETFLFTSIDVGIRIQRLTTVVMKRQEDYAMRMRLETKLDILSFFQIYLVEIVSLASINIDSVLKNLSL